MDLVDKEDDIRAFLQLFHECLHALFKLPAVLCPGHDGGHVQHDNAFVEKDTRDVALANANSQTFYNGCLADAGFSDEDGVVFLAAAEDLRYALDLFFPTDDGVEFSAFACGGRIKAIFVQRRRVSAGGVAFLFVFVGRPLCIVACLFFIFVVCIAPRIVAQVHPCRAVFLQGCRLRADGCRGSGEILKSFSENVFLHLNLIM